MIRIHDSLSRRKRPLEPIAPGLVQMYVCGPTVYDDSHIGHLMGPVLFDTVARWLRARGLQVRFVVNITDIDDKIIQRAHRTGEDWRSIAQRYTAEYLTLLEELRVTTITDMPRCTDYVPQMIRFVEDLVEAGRAYETSDGVYYDVSKQRDYGKLSGRRLDELLSGARVEASDELKHPADFALWKKAKPGEPSWPSPWGEGRPGWHLECSVMAGALLGAAFDIHGGGDDLKFPHHENEIAQSEAHGDGFARCWLHNGLVQYGGRKVAKSDPRMNDEAFARQFQARWLVDNFGAPAIRFFLLRGHYRRPIDFEPHNLEAARTGLLRLLRQLGPLLDEPGETGLDEILARELSPELAVRRERFCAAMDDDFGTGEAVAELFSIAHFARGLAGADQDAALRLLRDLGRVLGLCCPGDAARLSRGGAAADERLAAVVEGALALRESARTARDFATADALRDVLTKGGVLVQDATGAAHWEIGDGGGDLPLVLDGLLAARQAARGRKDFATADAIRDLILAAGIAVHDGPEGSRWEL